MKRTLPTKTSGPPQEEIEEFGEDSEDPRAEYRFSVIPAQEQAIRENALISRPPPHSPHPPSPQQSSVLDGFDDFDFDAAALAVIDQVDEKLRRDGTLETGPPVAPPSVVNALIQHSAEIKTPTAPKKRKPRASPSHFPGDSSPSPTRKKVKSPLVPSGKI